MGNLERGFLAKTQKKQRGIRSFFKENKKAKELKIVLYNIIFNSFAFLKFASVKIPYASLLFLRLCVNPPREIYRGLIM